MSIPKNKVISIYILPIFLGGLISILLHIVFTYLGGILFPDLAEFFDGIIVVLISYFIPALIGGFVTTYFSAKKKLILTLLSAIIFIIGIILPEINEFIIEFGSFRQENILFLLLFIIIVLAAMLGGYIGIRMKRRRVIN